MKKFKADKECWIIINGEGRPSIHHLTQGRELVTSKPQVEVFYRHFDAIAKMRILNPAFVPQTPKEDTLEEEGSYEERK